MIWRDLPTVFEGQHIIGAIAKKRQFVIVEDGGKYTASFRKLGSTKTIHIIDFDHRVTSLDVAKAACEQALHEQ